MSLFPLPKIDGDVDLYLDVHTHNSLQSGAPNDDYGDTNRLAELGAKVLDLTVTYHLYSQRPFLSAEEMANNRNAHTSDQSIDGWLTAYNLKGKLRISPDQMHLLNDPGEMRKYFHTYIGALYIRNGLPTIQAWISALIDPNVEVKLPDMVSQSPPQYSQPNMGYGLPSSSRTYDSYPSPPHQMGHYAPAPPPAGAPPPLPAGPPSTMSTFSSLVTLSLVNQTAAQKGFQVSYPAQQEGPPHQPTWTVRCCMNGVERGIGIGKSQKIAKEEAARQAWAAMGWGPT